MADHNKPVLTSTYTNFVSELDARFDDLALMLDPANTTATNVPTNSIRWNSALAKFQKYNGTSWGDLSATYNFTAGAFTTLSASGTVESTATPFAFKASGASNLNHLFQSTNGTQDVRLGIDGSNNCYTGTVSNHDFLIQTNGATRGVFSSTGLAVTGVISGSSELQLNAVNAAIRLQTSGTNKWALINDFPSAGQMTVYDHASTANRAVFSNTGLAVTGALSATGQINSGNATGIAVVNAAGSGNYLMYNGGAGAASDFRLRTGGVDNAILDTAGNLGLGVTPSAWGAGKALQVGDYCNIHYDAGFTNFGNNFYNNAGYKYRSSDFASRYMQGAGSHYWFTAPSGTAGNAITFTQAMTLDASGNLLVGKSTTTFSSVGAAQLASGELDLTTSGINALALNRLASDGSVATFYRQTVSVGSITVSAAATAYNTSSDYRLKEDIEDLSGSADFIAALRPRTYKWKVNGERGVGFIAHELQAVSPSSVQGEKDAVDVDGNPLHQSVEYGSAEVIAHLVKLAQEQQAKIEALTARIQTLENANA